ncbi:TDP-4-oxo-6-deoxy-alpha-D-glucose-3,4-oxoisomerase [Shimia sp. SK013]|uniref:sugar 3,4-ketoisomerase n=1 Tax=Shimia sp. SK013 TaxID=1389006 RepID=UPI0006B4BF5F|nr:FdtA/QdtA family cupin domain-containing protein [Shimia sp. SK013]KPA23611.1 TDP-4-oxo-6-deoxy-alpha-D-glucose-3,4-oxoisomerase [Shimia sp. SK013]
MHIFQGAVADLPEGVRFLEYDKIADARGSLIPFDMDKLPFLPQRLFLVEGAQGGSRRGQHAHRTAQQLFCCVSGRVGIQVRNGAQSTRFDLVPDGVVALIEAGTWSAQTYRSKKDRLLVLSSERYSKDSYLD